MRWISAFTLIIFTVLALPASAQVHRCKDTSGKMTYTDTLCGTGQSGGLIERQRAQSAIYEERMQAAEAEDRKQAQRIAEQEREWAAQSQRALQYQAAPPVQHSGNNWAARKALKNAQTSSNSITNNGGRWDQAAESQRKQINREKARREQAQHEQKWPEETDARRQAPTNFTNCNGGFCYDNQGGTYHRNGPDFMTGPKGSSCHRNGNMWNCN